MEESVTLRTTATTTSGTGTYRTVNHWTTTGPSGKKDNNGDNNAKQPSTVVHKESKIPHTKGDEETDSHKSTSEELKRKMGWSSGKFDNKSPLLRMPSVSQPLSRPSSIKSTFSKQPPLQQDVPLTSRSSKNDAHVGFDDVSEYLQSERFDQQNDGNLDEDLQNMINNNCNNVINWYYEFQQQPSIPGGDKMKVTSTGGSSGSSSNTLAQEFQQFHKLQHLPKSYKFAVILITCFLFPISLYNVISYASSTSSSSSSSGSSQQYAEFITRLVFQIVIDILLFLLTVVSLKICFKYSTVSPTEGIKTLVCSIGMRNVEPLSTPSESVSEIADGQTSAKRLLSRNTSKHVLRVNQISPSPSIGSMKQPSIRRNKQSSSMASLKSHSGNSGPSHTNNSDPIRGTSYFHYEHCLLIIIQVLMMFSMVRTMILANQANASDANQFILHSNVLQIPNILGTGYIEFYASVASFWLLFFPYIIFTTLSDICVSLIWILFIISTLFVLIPLIAWEAYRAIPFVIMVVVWFVCMTIDHQLQKIHTFLLHRKMLRKLKEQEKLNAQEMRHMIANVAHDLKTPLASFLTGLDCIQLSINDCKESFSCDADNQRTQTATYQENSKRTPVNRELQCQMEEHCSLIQSNLANIRNTHAFMLMTINRCLDYTKASKGLKLVPHNETIDLIEALQLPFDCMRNIQSRITLTMSAFPEFLCQYVITDKQWLQENVLCLLSNAVKYSLEGTVNVNLSIEEYSIEKSNGASDDETGTLGTISMSGRHPQDTSFRNPFSRKSSKMPSLRAEPTSTRVVPYVRIEVEDTGIGMSDEAMTSLFNPFKQTQRLAGGTGLGLYSLAKRLEALHGFYGVMKRRDGKQGSLFWFAFPYKPDTVYAQHMKKKDVIIRINSNIEPAVSNLSQRVPSLSVKNPPVRTHSTENERDGVGMVIHDQNPTVAQHQMTPTSAFNVINSSTPSLHPTLHILLADDSPPILKMSSLMLQKLGNQVTTAENGAIALKLIEERLQSTNTNSSTFSHKSGSANAPQHYDLLLIDLQMPVMDGLEAIGRIRALEAQYNITEVSLRRHKIVGMSANSDEETYQQAIQAGADAFLAKPFSIETITQLLHDIDVL